MRASPNRVSTFLLVAVALLSIATPTRAQSITLPSIVYRQQALRPYNQLPTWINYEDCRANDKLSFTLAVLNYVGSGGNQYTLQAWAGTASCKDPTARTGTNPACWLVYAQTPPANVTNYTVTLSAQQLVGRKIVAGTPPSSPPAASASDCDTGTGGHQQLYVDFMFVDANNTIVGTAAEYTAGGFDITPPAPPTGVTLRRGDTRLNVAWTSGGDADLVEFRQYCVPYPGGGAGQLGPDGGLRVASLSQAIEAGAASGGATGAGGTPGAGGVMAVAGAPGTGGLMGTGGATSTGGAVATDAGSSGGLVGVGGTVVTGTGGGSGGATTATRDGGVIAPTGVSCDPMSVLVPGAIPNDAYRCGTSDKASTDGTISGLTNGVTYVVAVAAVDSVGNAGRLSANSCEAPVKELDFFDLYRAAGGNGGGGICSVSALRPATVSGWLLSALGAFVAAGAARRLRRRS